MFAAIEYTINRRRDWQDCPLDHKIESIERAIITKEGANLISLLGWSRLNDREFPLQDEKAQKQMRVQKAWWYQTVSFELDGRVVKRCCDM